MPDFGQILERIKRLDWTNATVSFSVVKRWMSLRQARYEILQVNADDNLRAKLRNLTVQKLANSNTALEYDFNTADLDDNLLGLPTLDTDFQKIIDQLLATDEPPYAEDVQQLIGAWLYIARLDIAGEPPLFAARRISESWSTKKVHQWTNAIFSGNMLVDVDHKQLFRIDGKVDFFSFDGNLFVADKKSFETALNFREGMERNRDEIVQEFDALAIFEDAPGIATLVGNNIRYLRRLSQVKKAGYYRDPAFLASLKTISTQEGWGIQYSANGKLVVTADDIETILRVLNNDRLTSKINSENFDVDVKRKLN